MIVSTLEPNGAVGYHCIKLGSGRESAKSPFLLVPAAPEDPWTAGIGLRKLGDLGECLFEAVCIRKIERERRETDIHDMDVRIDHARKHDLSFAVYGKIDVFGPLLTALENVGDYAVIVEN